MKILSTNFNQNSVSTNRYLPKKIFDTPKDTFVSSNPSFRAGEQKMVSQGAKTLVELGTVLAAGFAAFKSLTGGESELKDFDIKDFFKNLMGKQEELENKIQELEEENTKLKQENSELKAGQVNNNQTTQVPENQDETEASANEKPVEEQPQFVKFPPKRGLLSTEQRALKNTVIKLNISPEYNEKLTAICQDILKKGSKDAENKARTLNLAAELEACNGDIEKLKSVVDKYEIKEENSSDKPSVGAKEEGNASSSSEVRISGPKIVGTMDLSQVRDGKKNRPRISQSGKHYAAAQTASVDNDSAQAQTGTTSSDATITPSKDVSGTYTFSLPGTVHNGTKVNLTSALFHFEQQYLADKKEEAAQNGTKPDYIQWMFRRPVGHVTKDDVINEVSKCKTHGVRSKYNNIDKTNADDVVYAINDESRFKEMFTFHGSTKFIERFVDFNSDVPIEHQVHHAMDVFEETLQLAMKYGVDMEEHDDVFIRKDSDAVEIHKGTNITIPTECYTEEARKIFGSYPVKIGICRSGKMDRKAIICTIYPKGVY